MSAPAARAPLHDRIADAYLDRAAIDFLLVLLAVGAHAVLWRVGITDRVVGAVDPDERALTYGAIATVASLAAGTNNTAVGAYATATGDAVNSLRIEHGATLRKSLRGVGAWLWIVAVASLACLLLDPLDPSAPSKTRGAGWVAEAGVFLLALKFVRLTFIQDLLLKANDLSAKRARSPRRPRAAKMPEPSDNGRR